MLHCLRFCILLVAASLAACNGDEPLTAGSAAPRLADKAPVALHVLVIGGTSGIGLETVKLALARGHDVTAMARRPERMTVTHERLRVIQGDVLDRVSVATALDGANALVFAVGIPPTRDPVAVFSEGTANVLSALRADQKLIMVTGIGAGDSRGHGGFFYDRILQPLMLNTIYEDKDRSEAMIRDSEADWTIVRPGFLVDTASTQKYRVISDMEGMIAGDISRADVAHFIMGAIESDTFRGATVHLSN